MAAPVTNLLGLLALGLLLVAGRLLGGFSVLEATNLDASSQHLLELFLVAGLFFLLGLGEVLALLLELLDPLLLLLLLPGLLFLFALVLLLEPAVLFLEPGPLLSVGGRLLRFSSPELLLLLLEDQ